MIRVLIADNDLDSHELVDDLVEMIFRDVTIDRALSRESLFARIEAEGADYHLIVFNHSLDSSEIDDIISHIHAKNAKLIDRIVFITSEKARGEIPDEFPVLVRPFSLDDFNEVVTRICATTKS